MQKGFNGILLVPFFVLSLTLSAQVNTVSPYTRLGIGDISSRDFARAQGFGGANNGLYDPLNININNPASYSDLELTTFEVGFQFSKYRLEQSAPDIEQLNGSAGLRYFAFGLPVFDDWWGSVIGIQPFSLKGYDISQSTSFQDTINVEYNFTGSGGLNQFFWGNSFEVARGLSLGVNAALIFGKMEESAITSWNSNRFLSTKVHEVAQVKGINFNYGARYHHITSGGKSIGLGITYSNATDINADVGNYTYVFTERFGNEVPIDSLAESGERGSTIRLPGKFSMGISYGKYDSLILNHGWLVSADLEFTNSSGFISYDGTSPLVNSYRAEIGGYIRPRFAFDNLSRNTGYFANIEYRAGAFYEKTPYEVNGQGINDYGITFGLGLPVRHRSLAPGEQKVSTINTGIILGRRGTTANGLIRESYLNFYIGLTLNDRWFIKYRYR